MTASTDTAPSIELDDDTAAIAKYLTEINAHIKALSEEADTLKQRLRQALAVGQAGTVDGQVLVRLQPNRRFDTKHAAKILPAELLALCQVTKVDSAAAKKHLPPSTYELCMTEAGEPKVVLA